MVEVRSDECVMNLYHSKNTAEQNTDVCELKLLLVFPMMNLIDNCNDLADYILWL